MPQIADWLKKLGMSEYAARFAENRIDLTVLRDLTDQDLKDLGVVLGDRRKMLRAIAELNDARAGVAPAPAEAPAPPPIVAQPAFSAAVEAAGERRYLTVMFCDLADSTGIASRLDAEEWRDLVGAYLDAASAAVTEMGGRVAKKLGDGLMSLFGYPVAQENDSERAVRAALAIQRALAELNRKNAGSGKPALAARIGLETGPVVVDSAGEIFGDAPNIAARVQGLAEPVVVTARVQRQVAGLFIAEERGSHQLKGVLEPVTLFRLVRASGGGRRSGSLQLTPLVGRDEETQAVSAANCRRRNSSGAKAGTCSCDSGMSKSGASKGTFSTGSSLTWASELSSSARRCSPGTSAPPNRCRPHSAIGWSGVFCNSCEQVHSLQVCGVSRSRT